MFAISVLMQGLESRMYEEFLEIVFFLLKTTCEKNWKKKKKKKKIGERFGHFPYKRLPER